VEREGAVLNNIFGRNTLDDMRAEDLRKLNELLQKQPKNPRERPVTWAISKAVHTAQ
jgi:hypothetical protein